MSRFAVGHTHADLDRFFGYINQILFGTAAGGKKAGADVPTREEFKRLCLEAMKAKKDTMLLDHHMEDLLFAFDFWALLKPHINPAFKKLWCHWPNPCVSIQAASWAADPAHLLQVLVAVRAVAASGWVLAQDLEHAAELARCRGEGVSLYQEHSDRAACTAEEAVAVL